MSGQLLPASIGFLVVAVTTTAAWLARRHEAPLRARAPILVLMCAASNAAVFLLPVVGFYSKVVCSAVPWLACSLIACFVVSLVRVMRLYHLFQWNRRKLAVPGHTAFLNPLSTDAVAAAHVEARRLARDQLLHSKSHTHEHQHLVRAAVGVAIACCLALVQTMLPGVSLLPTLYPSCGQDASHIGLVIGVLGTGAAMLAVVVLQPLNDRFGLRTDLLPTMCSFSVTFASCTVLGYLPPTILPAQRASAWLHVVLLCHGLLVHGSMIAWPVMRSLGLSLTTSTEASAPAIDNLEEILDSQIACEYFKAFLAQEFCVESLLFVQDVQAFRALSDARLMLFQASLIQELYMQPDAPLEVNISCDARRDMIETLKQCVASGEAPPASLFDEAHCQILYLLRNDALPRFRRSDLCALFQRDVVSMVRRVSAESAPAETRSRKSSRGHDLARPAVQHQQQKQQRTQRVHRLRRVSILLPPGHRSPNTYDDTVEIEMEANVPAGAQQPRFSSMNDEETQVRSAELTHQHQHQQHQHELHLDGGESVCCRHDDDEDDGDDDEDGMDSDGGDHAMLRRAASEVGRRSSSIASRINAEIQKRRRRSTSFAARYRARQYHRRGGSIDVVYEDMDGHVVEEAMAVALMVGRDVSIPSSVPSRRSMSRFRGLEFEMRARESLSQA